MQADALLKITSAIGKLFIRSFQLAEMTRKFTLAFPEKDTSNRFQSGESRADSTPANRASGCRCET